ncbi:hypothetical protein F5884DRAFT_350187 [Xylogone sp. PMI_703]|nr:hypothetical protein F5884DRAFT_350187 [Xylogone sp. PMI_703]
MSNDLEPDSPRYGLLPLSLGHPPEHSTATTCHLDVIAIHGMSGNALSTWVNTKNELWLRDYLPKKISGARVYSFGYDRTRLAGSWEDITSIAKDLLGRLEEIRQSEVEKQRKIVFICHSLGGIICKRALVYADATKDEIHENIVKSTKAIVFFGTPHFPPEDGDLPLVVSNILTSFGSLSEKDTALLNFKLNDELAYEEYSRECRYLTESFIPLTKEIEIFSWYEKKASGPPHNTVFVPPNSATLGVPTEHLDGINETHEDMCRLEKNTTDMKII